MNYLRDFKLSLMFFVLALLFWHALPLMADFRSEEEPPAKTVIAENVRPPKKEPAEPAKPPWHPPHIVKTWTASHQGSKFRITQIPRCEHIETLFTYVPQGETVAAAKTRVDGITALTGCFHHPRSFALADFFQRDGRILAPARTGRAFLVVLPDGSMDITKDYAKYKGEPGVSAMAMGQSLIPWERDGFSVAFMKQKTDRMAIGINNHYIFIIQGRATIYTLASYIKKNLPVHIAVNSDGGHVVRGVAPVHVVFRWKPKGIARELLK